jgi:hypothetical protein
MRALRTARILTVLATLAALAACAPFGRNGRSETVVSAQWDSGPLDRDYGRQRAAMDTRHSQEIANPRADESADRRVDRQATESRDLEHRYDMGKASHSQSLPASDR